MHAICRIGQVCGRKKGLRMLIFVIYAIFASRFYYSAQDTGIFMGMFRIASGSYLEYVSVAVYGRGNSACLGTVL